MEAGEALELAKGDFSIVRILEDNISLATVVKIGDDLQWPLTKDEPVVKLDLLHYLFSLPMKDGDPLSYGVAFLEDFHAFLGRKLHQLESTRNVDWKEFAPNVEYYNNFLAKAIAGGTGQVVKGIFKCSNAYTNQVHKGGEMILSRAAEQKNGAMETVRSSSRSAGSTKKSKVNKSIKRVRKLSRMTEKLSKTMLTGVGLATGSVITPLVKSQAGKAFLSMVPGEVLLASLDAVNKIMDAAEVAERQALSATSKATSRMISDRFGESAGEAAEDAFATAGHCVCIAWNVFKIRKAVNPATSISTGVLKSAARNTKKSY
ncbi:senescence/dehydration-associated protein [Salix suchowensis]|nr:senescence/dehydration-associated protein [Salix suchowensis]